MFRKEEGQRFTDRSLQREWYAVQVLPSSPSSSSSFFAFPAHVSEPSASPWLSYSTETAGFPFVILLLSKGDHGK